MNTFGTLNGLLAVILGLITAVVSWRLLHKGMGIRNPLIGAGVGTLAGIGLANQGGVNMSALLIPYEALAIAIVVMCFLGPFLKGKKDVGRKPFLPKDDGVRRQAPDDPWEREIRAGGKLANRFKVRKRNSG